VNEAASHPADPSMQLRRAILGDMAAVARIRRLAFFHAMPHMPVLHTPEDDLTFFSTVVFPGAEIWLSERSGVPAGFLAFRPGWVDHLYVHPDHQGCGIGNTLLALAQFSEPSLRLWTFQCNLRARRFYEQRGFRIERETDGADNEERQPDILYSWSRDPFSNHRHV
jgi:ribosomal protein S18 acetylase RimI-like enzyme